MHGRWLGLTLQSRLAPRPLSVHLCGGPEEDHTCPKSGVSAQAGSVSVGREQEGACGLPRGQGCPASPPAALPCPRYTCRGGIVLCPMASRKYFRLVCFDLVGWASVVVPFYKAFRTFCLPGSALTASPEPVLNVQGFWEPVIPLQKPSDPTSPPPACTWPLTTRQHTSFKCVFLPFTLAEISEDGAWTSVVPGKCGKKGC